MSQLQVAELEESKLSTGRHLSEASAKYMYCMPLRANEGPKAPGGRVTRASPSAQDGQVKGTVKGQIRE